MLSLVKARLIVYLFEQRENAHDNMRAYNRLFAFNIMKTHAATCQNAFNRLFVRTTWKRTRQHAFTYESAYNRLFAFNIMKTYAATCFHLSKMRQIGFFYRSNNDDFMFRFNRTFLFCQCNFLFVVFRFSCFSFLSLLLLLILEHRMPTLDCEGLTEGCVERKERGKVSMLESEFFWRQNSFPYFCWL